MIVGNNAPSSGGPLLRDIHMPPPPPWWPPAPGWWIVLVLVVVMLGFWMWFARRWRQRRQVERALTAEVDGLLVRLRDQPTLLATQLHALLRRAAVRLDPQAASYRAEAWRQMLSRLTPDQATLDALLTLEPAMYQRAVLFDADVAAKAVREWLVLSWRHRSTYMSGRDASSAVAQEAGHA